MATNYARRQEERSTTVYDANTGRVIDKSVQNRGGFAGGIKYLGEQFVNGVTSFAEGAVDSVASAYFMLTGQKSKAEQVLSEDWRNYDLATEIFNPGKGWKIAGDVAQASGYSAPGMAISTVAGIAGAGKIAKIGTTFLSSSIPASGNAMKEAYRESGKIDANTALYGALSGALEGAVESAGDVIGIGLGAAKNALGVGIASKVVRDPAWKTLAKAFTGEATEEIVSALLDPYVKRATYEPDAQGANAGDVAYSALIGGLSGMLGGAGSITINTAVNTARGTNVVQKGQAQNIVTASKEMLTALESAGIEDDNTQYTKQILHTIEELEAGGKLGGIRGRAAIGELSGMAGRLSLEPMIYREAATVTQNAKAVASEINAFYQNGENGEKIYVSPEDLTRGVVFDKGQKTYQKSLIEAMKTNEKLRNVVVLSTANKLMMNTGDFASGVMQGSASYSERDVNAFIENATNEQKNKLSSALGIDNWDTVTAREFGDKYAEYIKNNGLSGRIQIANRLQNLDPAKASTRLPTSARVIITDRRFNDGNIDIAVHRDGDSYIVYDFNDKVVTKPMSVEEMNSFLADARRASEEMTERKTAARSAAQSAAQSYAQEENDSRLKTAEIEQYLRENVKEYAGISAPSRSYVRATVRQARAHGLSEEDVKLLASVTAKTGTNIVFDRELEDEGGANGKFAGDSGTIFLNPTDAKEKMYAKILMHELDHKLTRDYDGKKLIDEAWKNIEPEKRQKVVDKYTAFYKGRGLSAAQIVNIINDEVNSAYAEELASDPRVWDYILREEPTAKGRVMTFFRRQSINTEVEGLSKEARKYLERFKKMFDALEKKESGMNAYRVVENEEKDGESRMMFAGEKSKSADKSMLEKAKELEKEGKSSEEIRKATGWFRGMEGQWRYEINDRKVQIDTTGAFSRNPDIRRYIELFNKVFVEDTGTKEEEAELLQLENSMQGVSMEPHYIGDLIKADELFAAYPSLQDIKIFAALNIREQAAYSEGFNEIMINRTLYHSANKKKLKNAIIHELQHAVQAMEGFTSGSNTVEHNFDEYYKTAGEIEARDAASRAELTDEERKNIRPDVDRKDVVFNEGVGANFSYDGNEFVNNIEFVAKMGIVSKIAEEKLMKTGKKPSTIFSDFFESINNVINSKRYGEIKCGTSSVRSEIRHGLTAEKIASIEAIPDVIEKGKVIYSGKKVNTEVIRTIIAAPIKIGDAKYYMGVMLQSDSQNKRLYLHNVVIEEEASSSIVDLLTTGTIEENEHLFITSILQKINNVNRKIDKIEKLNGNVKNTSKNSDTGERLSLPETDSDGNELSKQQRKYFKDSKIIDEEGNLLVVYHGTDAEFTVFDKTKGRSGMDIQGMFFSPWELDAKGYGSKVKAYYLNIKNPASESVAYKALNKFKGQNEAGKKARQYLESIGYDGVNNENEEYIAFYPEQIKLIDNKNPTENEDVRYSMPDEEPKKVKEPEGADKVFTQAEVRRDVAGALKQATTVLDGGRIELPAEERKKVTARLLDGFNNARSGYRTEVAQATADYIMQHALVAQDAEESETVSEARRITSAIGKYMHKINLSGIEADMRATYDDKYADVARMWGKKDGISPVQMIMALREEEMINTGEETDAGAFAALVDMYKSMRNIINEFEIAKKRVPISEYADETVRKKVRAEIVNGILNAYSEGGKQTEAQKARTEAGKYLANVKRTAEEERLTGEAERTLADTIREIEAYTRKEIGNVPILKIVSNLTINGRLNAKEARIIAGKMAEELENGKYAKRSKALQNAKALRRIERANKIPTERERKILQPLKNMLITKNVFDSKVPANEFYSYWEKNYTPQKMELAGLRYDTELKETLKLLADKSQYQLEEVKTLQRAAEYLYELAQTDEKERSLLLSGTKTIVLSNDKMYSRSEAEKAIDDMITGITIGENGTRGAAKLTNEQRERIIGSLYYSLMSAKTQEEKKSSAKEIARRIISQATYGKVAENVESESIKRAIAIVQTMDGIVQDGKGINFEKIKPELKTAIGKEYFAMNREWSGGKNGISIDDVTKLLTERGIIIDATDELSRMIDIRRKWNDAKDVIDRELKTQEMKFFDDAEKEKIANDIENAVMNIYEEGGTMDDASRIAIMYENAIDRLGEEMKEQTRKITAENRLKYAVERIKDWKTDRFQSATQFNAKGLLTKLQSLSGIVIGGNVSAKRTRSVMDGIGLWYIANKDALSSIGAYDESIADAMNRIATADRDVTGEEDAMISDIANKLESAGLFKYNHDERGAMLARSLLDVYDQKNANTAGITYSRETRKDLRRISDEDVLTRSEIEMTNKVVSYFKHLTETRWNRIYLDGKWIDAEEYEKYYYENIKKSIDFKKKTPILHKMTDNLYTQAFADPYSVMLRMDDYNENGFFCTMLNHMRDGLIKSMSLELYIRKPLEDFYEKNQNYLSEINREKIAFNDFTNLKGAVMTKAQMISYYMTSKRQHAQAGLVFGGVELAEYDSKGRETGTLRVPPALKYETPDMLAEVPEVIKGIQGQIEAHLTAKDKEYIAAVESAIARTGDVKGAADIARTGISQVSGEYYYPIKRADRAQNVDTTPYDEASAVIEQSFNQRLVQGTKTKLVIEPVDKVVDRHISGVSKYAGMWDAIDNFNILWNTSIDGYTQSNEAVRTAAKELWKDADKFFVTMRDDIKGKSREDLTRWIAKIRGAYATGTLALNPKVLMTQSSSLFAATSEIDPSSIIKSARVSGKDVDEYCELARIRNSDNTAYKAQTLTAEKMSNAKERMMRPIAVCDRAIVRRLFAACQVQVAKDSGNKIGTQENKKKAGELLKKVILNTQQNATATDRSAAMRSSSEFFKSITMFTADAMKVASRVLDAYGELNTLKAQKKLAKSGMMSYSVSDAQIKAAKKKLRKASGALLMQAIYMTMISKLFALLYGYDRDKDKNAMDYVTELTVDTIGNTLGGMPGISDIFDYFASGYEMTDPTYTMIADMMSSAMGVYNMTVKLATGTGSMQDITSAMRKMSFSTAKCMGLPLLNVWKLSNGILHLTSPKAGTVVDNVFSKQNYKNGLKNALENGDDGMAELYIAMGIEDATGGKGTYTAEIARLAKEGYSVMPSGLRSTYMTYSEDYYQLSDEVRASMSAEERAKYQTGEAKTTNKQRKAAEAVYGQANNVIEKLTNSATYSIMSDEQKAIAIETVYSAYREMANRVITGDQSKESKKVLMMNALGADTYAAMCGIVYGIKEDGRRSKKENVIRALKSQNAPREKVILMLMSMGYTVQDGEIGTYTEKQARTAAARYINSLNISPEEKKRIAEACGFTVVNGKIK